MASLPDLSAIRARQWLRTHPLAPDALLAVAAFVLILIGSVADPHGYDGKPRFGGRELEARTVVLAALACAALVVRRRLALPVLAVTGLLTLVQLVTGGHADDPGDRRAPIVFAVAVALYTVASRTDRNTTWRFGALTVAVLTAAAMLFGARPWYAQENLGILAWTGMAAAIGDAVRSRRAVVDAIRERAERAERTREEEARRRVAEERMRIARELHDVVAHHIALVNVQAGVASHVMDTRPDQAKQALSHIREASRHALDELQTTVGLLRQSGDPAAPTEPAPRLGMLGDLVDGFVRAGLSVTAPEPGAAGPLPSAVDLTAYRVVQEALTNVHKHAGPGTHADVRLVRAPHTLEITVLDDGAGDPAAGPGPDGGGHGLLGMRERAAALGGECEAGPVEGGGFRVRVTLPLQPPRRAEDQEGGRQRPGGQQEDRRQDRDGGRSGQQVRERHRAPHRAQARRNRAGGSAA